MGRKTRQFQIGAPYHVAHRGNHKQQLFESDDDRRFYLGLIARSAKLTRMSIAGYCLMSNHVHFLVVPSRRWSISGCFGRAHRRYSEVLNHRRGMHGANWEGRFFAEMLDDRHAINVLRYIERNPVAAGLVTQPWDWAWSSAAQHVGERCTRQLLDHRLNVMPPSPWTWREMVETPLSTTELETIAWETIVESGAQMGSGTPQLL